jgi:hypothetical protein
VSDLPVTLSPGPAATLASALDRERKLDRALDALGPMVDRDVLFVGGGPDEIARWTAAGARATNVESLADEDAMSVGDASADVILSAWSGFRGIEPAELATADRILRPGGRLLVVHDYGRDDVSRVRGELPEYQAWSRRDGPFLSNGFRVRVVHCFWTFDTIEIARELLADAFGPAGVEVGAGLKRARLSWNVAVYHRTRGDAGEPALAAQGARAR